MIRTEPIAARDLVISTIYSYNVDRTNVTNNEWVSEKSTVLTTAVNCVFWNTPCGYSVIHFWHVRNYISLLYFEGSANNSGLYLELLQYELPFLV